MVEAKIFLELVLWKYDEPPLRSVLIHQSEDEQAQYPVKANELVS